MSKFFVHSSSFVDEGVEIGEGTKIWHFSHILSGSKIGKNCSIGQNVVIGPNVSIGDNCKIQNNVSVYEGLELKNNVFLGPSCVFTNVINPSAHIIRKEEYMKTTLGVGSSIGANATVICGNNIGEYALIGAGSVVTKHVKNFSLVVGNPAKHYKWVSKSADILDDSLICKITGEKYILNNGILELCSS